MHLSLSRAGKMSPLSQHSVYLSSPSLNCKIHLFKLLNVFLQIAKFICQKCKIYMIELLKLSFHFAKCICFNFKVFVKFVFVQIEEKMHLCLSSLSTCTCHPSLTFAEKKTSQSWPFHPIWANRNTLPSFWTNDGRNDSFIRKNIFSIK